MLKHLNKGMLNKSILKQLKKKLDTNDRWVKLFDALSDNVRYKMFKLLIQNKNICVSEIAKLFDISVPAASQQLKILELNGLIERLRKGQTICYQTKKDNSEVNLIIKLISK